MSRQRDGLRKGLNENFSVILDKVLTNKFGEHRFKTSWSIIDMALITSWDPKASKKQKLEWRNYASAFSDGYMEVLNQIH